MHSFPTCTPRMQQMACWTEPVDTTCAVHICIYMIMLIYDTWHVVGYFHRQRSIISLLHLCMLNPSTGFEQLCSVSSLPCSWLWCSKQLPHLPLLSHTLFAVAHVLMKAQSLHTTFSRFPRDLQLLWFAARMWCMFTALTDMTMQIYAVRKSTVLTDMTMQIYAVVSLLNWLIWQCRSMQS